MFRTLRTALALCLPATLVLQSALADGAAEAPVGGTRLLNASFEEGLTGWRTEGDAGLETDAPIKGTASLRIGPGPGSVAQRLSVGHGGHLWISATVKSEPPGAGALIVRYLAKDGSELMRLDSTTDKAISKKKPGNLTFSTKEHPLTEDVEIILCNKTAGARVLADNVEFVALPEPGADLHPTWDLAQVMQPFWQGRTVYNEAVLMVAGSDEVATGRLMFTPTRILSVKDFALGTVYAEGSDYAVEGRKLICPKSSRMPQIREAEFARGELNWNKMAGKHVVVTYEHEDAWTGPMPSFAGDQLPNTLRKLRARKPLKVVAYGDSITHGVGASRLLNIPPYLPPYPELFVQRLKAIYQDDAVEFYNSAQNGAASDWAARLAGRMVAAFQPDLVIIAFGQNDFWEFSADVYLRNISSVIETVRIGNPQAEFLLVSPMRFDPAYTSNARFWRLVGEYAASLRRLVGPGVQLVDVTAISEAIYAAKKPKDCVTDPLHPNDYLSRWYAQALTAALDPDTGERSGKTEAGPVVSRVNP